jgi:hypothetical protein
LTRNDETLSWKLSTIFYAEFSTDDQLGKNTPGPGQPVWRGLAIGAIDCMVDMGFLNDERHPMTRLSAEFDELVFHLALALYERHENLYPTQEGKPAEGHHIWTKTARAVVEYMKTIELFFVEEEPDPALILRELPDGSYYDGTYEWEKDGIYWTPLMAPSGMPSEPDPKRLRRVIKTYEAIA